LLTTTIGFQDVRIDAHVDCFRGTSKEHIARKYGVTGVNLYARKSL